MALCNGKADGTYSATSVPKKKAYNLVKSMLIKLEKIYRRKYQRSDDYLACLSKHTQSVLTAQYKM
jgi:hypothetical protein